jgi:hypothetical protein
MSCFICYKENCEHPNDIREYNFWKKKMVGIKNKCRWCLEDIEDTVTIIFKKNKQNVWYSEELKSNHTWFIKKKSYRSKTKSVEVERRKYCDEKCEMGRYDRKFCKNSKEHFIVHRDSEYCSEFCWNVFRKFGRCDKCGEVAVDGMKCFLCAQNEDK